MEEMYGTLRGHLPAKLVALFKIRDHRSENSVIRLASIPFVSAVNSGRLSWYGIYYCIYKAFCTIIRSNKSGCWLFSRLPAHRREETKEEKELLLLTPIDAGSGSDLIILIDVSKEDPKRGLMHQEK